MRLGVNRWKKQESLSDWALQPRLAWSLSILWLLLIAWLAFFWHLSRTGLVDETEPLFAEASRQMTVTGDWITPYFNGATRFDKPILLYWCQALAYTIFGVHPLAVRLPSAISALAITALSFYTLRYFGIPNPSLVQQAEINQTRRERQLWISAALGATMIALNPLIIGWARTGVSDMLLTLGMGGGLLAFFLGYAQSEPALKARWYFTLYVLIGLAILTKGPIGILLPALIIGAFLLYMGNGTEVLPEMELMRGVVVIVIITLPWYLLVTLKNGESFINSFFLHHNVDRFTSAIDNQGGPWYIYVPIVLLGFAPWSIYLPVAIARLRFWQIGNWRSQPRSAHLGVFALLWFVVILVFFSIAVTKRPNYVMPLIPAAGIMIALLWSEQMTRFEQSKLRAGLLWSGVFNVILLLALALVTLYSTNLIGDDPAAPNMISVIEQSGLPFWGGIIWGLTTLFAVLFLLKKQASWLWGVNLVGFLAFLIFVVMPASVLVDEVRQLPLRELSAKVIQVQKPGEELMMIGFPKPSVAFYTQEDVNYILTPEEAEKYIEAKAANQPNPPSFLILSQPDLLEKTGINPVRYQYYQTLDEAGGYKLIRVSRPVSP